MDAKTRKASITGALNAAVTNPLGPRAAAAPSVAAPPVPVVPPRGTATEPLATPEEDESESKKRMKVIMAYLKEPNGHPLFADKPAFLKILTDERAYLHRLIFEQQKRIKTLGVVLASQPHPSGEAEPSTEVQAQQTEVAELEAQVARFQQRQAQIFQIMKKLTGIKRSTGGTGFLAAPPTPGNDEKPPSASS